MRTLIVSLLFSFLHLVSFAKEKQVEINLLPTFGLKPLVLNTFYSIGKNDSVKIEMLKFYLSGFELLKEGKVMLQEKNSFHLVDASVPSSLKILLSIKSGLEFDQLRFNLGIDSTTNVSGALGGDLDPTKGMYWSWQSGYINFKLEGKSKIGANRLGEFQLHLGGYLKPHAAVQTILLPIQNKAVINVEMNLEKIITAKEFSSTTHIMSPSDEAVSFSRTAATCFSISEK